MTHDMTMAHGTCTGGRGTMIIHNDDDDDDDDDDSRNVSSSIIVIENIASLDSDHDDHDHDDDGDDNDVNGAAVVVAHEETSAATHLLSLSTATSATSIASALSDGVSRPRSIAQLQQQQQHPPRVGNLRPRSVSLNLPSAIASMRSPSSSSSSIGRRPRSNPRSRTPMRHVSPLLVTGRAVTLVYESNNSNNTRHGVEDDRHAGRPMTNAISGNSACGVLDVFTNNDEAAVTKDADASVVATNHTTPGVGSIVLGMSRTSHPQTNVSMDPSVVIPEEKEDDSATNVKEILRNRDNPIIYPIEEEVAVAANAAAAAAPPTSSTNHHRSASLRRDTFHWLAQPASSTIHTTRPQRSGSSGADTTAPRRTRSNKQHPSHRKVRRWNNDRFVGTTSEHLHYTTTMKMDSWNDNAEGLSDYDYYTKHPYIMPNYPREYRSEFAKLIIDDSKQAQHVRERFLKGEVGSAIADWGGGKHISADDASSTMEDDGMMLRRIAEKYQKKFGISLSKLGNNNWKTTIACSASTNIATSGNSAMGKQMFRNLSPRIQAILSRIICATSGTVDDGNTTAIIDPFFSEARQLVARFENYLISLGSKEVDVTDDDLFSKVLSSPPDVVTRTPLHHHQQHDNALAVWVPTVHFYFDTDATSIVKHGKRSGRKGIVLCGNESETERRRNSAFYRILLYAVCQFHGMESTSSIKTAASGIPVKAVTVHGGLFLAPSLKVLDACLSVQAETID